MPEVPIGSRINVKTANAATDIADCTTLVLETSRGTRLTLADGEAEGEYEVYEKFLQNEEWRVAHDEAGAPVVLTLSPDYGTPLPAHLFAAGWLKFVGPAATIVAKVLG